MQLRPYQEQAVTRVLEEWKSGVKRTLLVMPTGTGKTIVFSKLSQCCVAKGDRILILAHRGELLEQAADKMAAATGLACAVEKADETCLDSWFRITVGSVQSMMRPKRLERFPKDYFDVIIVDEAHHCLADSYMRVINHFESANLLGVTATPDRGDFQDLGNLFESIAFEYTLPLAIKEGYLCKLTALTIPLTIDLTGVSMTAGDYSTRELGAALDPYLRQIAQEMKKYCKGRKTVIFLPLIATSQKMQQMLIEAGFKACEVNGESKDRKQILKDFDAGKYDVLCNSMLLTEGWDCPSVDCIVVLRATKIRSLYAQMVGRGTRIHKGKTDLLILDFLWHSSRHELCRPAYLITDDKLEADAMTKTIEDAGGVALELEDLVEGAVSDAAEETERLLAEKLKKNEKRKKEFVDPAKLQGSLGSTELDNYQAQEPWEMKPASAKQLKALEKMGVYGDDIGEAGKADLLITTLHDRREAGLSTAKQIRFLERKKFKGVAKFKFETAKKLIDMIAANGWRVPSGVDPETYGITKEVEF